MKRFVLRLLLFCLLPLPLLYAFSYIVDMGLRRSNSYYYSEWNDIFHGAVNADLVITGSSRAYVHVSPKILDSALGLNTYNLGMNGTKFLMQYDRFKIYLQHNKKPRYVVQTLDFSMLAENYELYAYQQFLPYLSDPDIRQMTEKYKGKFGFGEYYFPMFKYNNQNALVVEGLKSFLGHSATGPKYKGYEGQLKPWDAAFAAANSNGPGMSPYDQVIDSQSLTKFNEFLALCSRENIKVILVFPPIYSEFIPVFRNRQAILSLFESAAAKYNFPFLNFLDDELCADKHMFYNSQHLNKTGAEIFSRKLAAKLSGIVTK